MKTKTFESVMVSAYCLNNQLAKQCGCDSVAKTINSDALYAPLHCIGRKDQVSEPSGKN